MSSLKTGGKHEQQHSIGEQPLEKGCIAEFCRNFQKRQKANLLLLLR
jgi:hypothetical protein